MLPTILDKLSLTDAIYIDGRININEAAPEILMGIPALTPDLVNAIIGGRVVSTTGRAGLPPDHLNTGWLLSNGILTLNQMEAFDQVFTGGGDAWRVQAIGYFDAGGPAARIEAIIDATQIPAQVVYLRDLTDLGRGYTPHILSLGNNY